MSRVIDVQMSRVIDVQLRNPFPGLRPFQEGEEHLFFGRESQIHTMIDKLSATRFLAVVGTSGSGKSSLVNCGLRPALHGGLMANAGTAWRVAQIRPGGNPLRSLACALSRDGVLFSDFDSNTLALVDIIDASLRMSKLGLSRIYHDARLPEDTNLLIVVDQFEELFRYRQIKSHSEETQQRNEEAVAFVNLLLDARSHRDIPIYVVLTMRSDFLGDCSEFPGLPEAINESEYLIPRLTREERKAVITGPVGVGGADITPVLLTRLVNDVGDNPDQLSILQHSLNRTWAYWKNEGQCRGPLDLEHYEAIGTMARALDQHAERAYRELPSERHRKICEKIFKTLTDRGTDPRGIRRPTKFGTLCQLAEAVPGEVTETLQVFRKASRSFVMPPVPEDLGDDTIIDISHESLMRIWERLIAWTHEEVQSAQLYRRLTETASLNAEGKAGLWSDPDLQSALDWRAKENPTELWAELYGGGFAQSMSFLRASEDLRNREKHEEEERRKRELQQAQALAAERQQRLEEQAQATARLQRWLRVLVAATVCLVCVGAVAWWQWDKARQSLKDRDKALRAAQLAQKQAEHSKQQAEEQTRKTEAANAEMQLEAMRVRDIDLQSQTKLADTADELLKYTDPQLSTRWRLMKSQAQLSVGKYADADDLLSRVLDSVPDDSEARTARGYLRVLRGKPAEALRDFEYIRNNIDRVSPLNNLNLAVANAVLGNDAVARSSLKAAIEGMQVRDSEGGREASVPPEITRATGRATLEAAGATFETALYYMRANLEAYAGETTAFRAALDDANRKAQSLSPVAKKDAYFVAMTWAWFQCQNPEETCKYYGAFASQAALWERAGYKDWAGCYYERFQQQDARLHDKRYVQLANWVDRAKSALGSVPSCSDLREGEHEVLALEVEAREATARRDLLKARDLLNEALSKCGPAERTRLLFAKANALLAIGRAEREAASSEADSQSHMQRSGEALRELKRDCTEILKVNPKSAFAHIYRALAQDWLDPNSTETVLNDLRESLRVDPGNASSLRLIDQLVPAYEPQQSSYLAANRQYLERYYKTSPYEALTLEHQARLAKMDKRYGDALNLVDKAIAMDPAGSTDFSLYKLREEIQMDMGFDEVEYKRNLASGYRQARFVRKMRDNANPETAETNAWKILAELAKKGTNERLRCNPEVTVCDIVKTVEVHSEFVFGSIFKLQQSDDNGKSVIARIDRGRDDGIVIGTHGGVWSHYSKSRDSQERESVQLGSGEVLSVEDHSALVRIQVDHPEKDGPVQEQDLIWLKARTPQLPDRSSLWSAAKFKIAFLDEDDQAFVDVDYGSLYSGETHDSDAKVLQRMVDDIHRAALAYADQLKPLDKGAFAGKSLKQAMETADTANLNRVLDFVVKYPRDLAGKRLKLSTVYALWLQKGTP
jgi:hypothetical protein